MNNANGHHCAVKIGIIQGEQKHTASYPASRLKLGMTAVGFMTLASTAALISGFASSLHDLIRDTGMNDLMIFPAFALLFMSTMLMFDLAGGFILPRKFGIKPHTTPATYLKGVLTHGILLCLSILTIHLGGVIAGMAGSLLAILLLSCAAIAFQHPLACLVGSLTHAAAPPSCSADETQSPDSVCINSHDTSFSGSITGLPGNEKILLPLQWENTLGNTGMSVLDRRRQLIIKHGWRNRGLALAFIWVCASWILASLIAGFPDGTVTTTLNTVFCSSVFHFLGLLILPTPTRNMTIYVDRRMKEEPDQSDNFESWVQQFSDLTDGEKSRHPWIEKIFHPLPSVQSRLAGSPSPWAAWNATRTMLFLSIFTGGLLSRAVHCNVGRPDLWIIAPTD